MISSIFTAAALAISSVAPPATLLDLAGAKPPALEADDAVLVIIDAQEEYRNGKLPLQGFDEALIEIQKLRDWASRRGIPVVHVQHVAAPDALLFAQGSAMGAIVAELEPLDSESVVMKRLPNSFAGTDLSAILEKNGRRTLIITGYMTHMCVEATARAALDLGYTSFVVSDATATRDLPLDRGGIARAEDVKVIALASIADRFGWVVTTDEILEAEDQ